MSAKRAPKLKYSFENKKDSKLEIKELQMKIDKLVNKDKTKIKSIARYLTDLLNSSSNKKR